jgi:phosphate transport system ATP-binding protein
MSQPNSHNGTTSNGTSSVAVHDRGVPVIGQATPWPSPTAPPPFDPGWATTTTENPVITPEPQRTQAAGAGSLEPATLETVGLHAWFGRRQVLQGCSLRMEARRVTALIGPSGCGKSTFLRILNRMHEVIPGAQIAGSVELDGMDIYGAGMSVTQVRVRVGMVFQKPNPFPSMTIRQNVLAGLKLAGVSSSDKDGLVEQCLRAGGLWNEVKDRLDEGGMALSGGQQQRLCIARALAVRPQVLLMDEPCSALDPISTRVVEETIASLSDDITIVIVTHNMQQAQRVSNQCAFFLVEDQGAPGRIVEAGDTSKLFNDPDDPRTLAYVTGRFG